MKEATNNSHFTLRDRIKIQIGLETGITIKEIADSIHFSRQKVYREIFNNGLIKKKHSPNPLRRDCLSISSYPFVCNNCPKKSICILKGRYYYADHAQNLASFRLHSSRSGSQLSKEQIASINSLVSPRLNNGQSIHHIYEDHKAELPICERTLRHMVNRNELDAKNLSLRRTVGRKLTHRNKSKLLPFDPYLLSNRMYDDFLDNESARTWYVELDTVIGNINSQKVLLTIFFPKIGFMFARLLAAKEAAFVLTELQSLRSHLGPKLWQKFFPVILTDRGLEFNHLPQIESDEAGQKTTEVYFTDAYRSNQKAGIESNHRLIRYVIPKGTSFDSLTQNDIDILFSNINGLRRQSLNNSSPFELAKKTLGLKFLSLINIYYIPSKRIVLKPSLLNKKATIV